MEKKNNIDSQYIKLLEDILENGTKKQTRNGGTLSVFGRQIRHKMSEGFPLLTTKKMAFKTMVTELLWFLKGDTNIKYLVDNDCNIWNGDCYANYLKKWKPENTHVDGNYIDQKLEDERPLSKDVFIHLIKTNNKFAEKWGELGPIYGKQWRKWTKKKMYLSTDGSYENIYDEADQTVIDQISILINELKTNPDSRRLMVNAWNVGEIDQMVLPPCHFSFQCYSHEREGKRYLSLAWNQRSCDLGLGIPFNIASYGLLLEIIAKEVGMIPYELIGNLGDCHIYNNHIEPIKEQLNRDPYPLPTILFKTHLDQFDSIIDILRVTDFILDNYQSHSSIKLPLSN